MGRTLKRVPRDFDWPLHTVWQGYVLPPQVTLPTCQRCEGDGYTPEARAIAKAFYAQGDRELAWHDKLGQQEIDALVAARRLPPGSVAAAVNDAERRRLVHDAINRNALIGFRCERLGIAQHCPTCDGWGDIGTDAQRDAVENWEGTEPPAGDGYQLWETTSEGSPISPVFPSLELLAEWCEQAATTFGDARVSAAEWHVMLGDGFVHHREGPYLFF